MIKILLKILIIPLIFLKKFLVKIAKGIALALRFLNLFLPFLYCFVWGIFELTNKAITTNVELFFAGLIVVTIFGAMVYLISWKRKRERNLQKEAAEAKGSLSFPMGYQKVAEVDRPIISRTLQNPNYIMYEYQNRFELYYENGDKLEYVRTDYKDDLRKVGKM